MWSRKVPYLCFIALFIQYYVIQQFLLSISNIATVSLCLHYELPFDGGHFCGLCRTTQLHCPCGVFLGWEFYRKCCTTCNPQPDPTQLSTRRQLPVEASEVASSKYSLSRTCSLPCKTGSLMKLHHTCVEKFNQQCNRNKHLNADGPNGLNTECNSMKKTTREAYGQFLKSKIKRS